MADSAMEKLASINWDKLERDVVDRIRMLRLAAQRLLAPDDDPIAILASVFSEVVADDLILRNVILLEKFCAAIKMEGNG